VIAVDPLRRILPSLLLAATVSIPASALTAQGATVKVKVDSSRNSTRVVLTHSATVAYEVREADGRIGVA